MLAFVLTATFTIGVIVGIVGVVAYGKHICGMSLDEMSAAGCMFIDAGNNRTSTITLCTDDGRSDLIIFEK